MNELVLIGTEAGGLLLVGVVAMLIRPGAVAWRWLLVAAALLVLEDFLLTRGFGLLPHFPAGAHKNWFGKVLALCATLVVAGLPAFGWRRVGLTWRQVPGSWRAALPVVAVYALYPIVVALTFSDGRTTPEEVAFQLTMPGFEEEPFFRGVLLLALDRAFAGRWRALGVDWGWGALVTSLLFGLAHALDYDTGRFSFAPLTMLLTTVPAFVAVWLRLRTGSVVLPIVIHNFGNTVQQFL